MHEEDVHYYWGDHFRIIHSHFAIQFQGTFIHPQPTYSTSPLEKTNLVGKRLAAFEKEPLCQDFILWETMTSYLLLSFRPIIALSFTYVFNPSMMLAHYLLASHILCHSINHYLSRYFHIPHSHSLNPSHTPLPSLPPTLYPNHISFTSYNTFFHSLPNYLFLSPCPSLPLTHTHKQTPLIYNHLFPISHSISLALFLYPTSRLYIHIKF